MDGAYFASICFASPKTNKEPKHNYLGEGTCFALVIKF
jgi:hypothetical protein